MRLGSTICPVYISCSEISSTINACTASCVGVSVSAPKTALKKLYTSSTDFPVPDVPVTHICGLLFDDSVLAYS